MGNSIESGFNHGEKREVTLGPTMPEYMEKKEEKRAQKEEQQDLSEEEMYRRKVAKERETFDAFEPIENSNQAHLQNLEIYKEQMEDRRKELPAKIEDTSPEQRITIDALDRVIADTVVAIKLQKEIDNLIRGMRIGDLDLHRVLALPSGSVVFLENPTFEKLTVDSYNEKRRSAGDFFREAFGGRKSVTFAEFRTLQPIVNPERPDAISPLQERLNTSSSIQEVLLGIEQRIRVCQNGIYDGGNADGSMKELNQSWNALRRAKADLVSRLETAKTPQQKEALLELFSSVIANARNIDDTKYREDLKRYDTYFNTCASIAGVGEVAGSTGITYLMTPYAGVIFALGLDALYVAKNARSIGEAAVDIVCSSVACIIGLPPAKSLVPKVLGKVAPVAFKNAIGIATDFGQTVKFSGITQQLLEKTASLLFGELKGNFLSEVKTELLALVQGKSAPEVSTEQDGAKNIISALPSRYQKPAGVIVDGVKKVKQAFTDENGQQEQT